MHSIRSDYLKNLHSLVDELNLLIAIGEKYPFFSSFDDASRSMQEETGKDGKGLLKNLAIKHSLLETIF